MAKYARETGLPYLGLCLGMQIAVVEFARNVLGLTEAHSSEFVPDSPDPVIHLMESQESVTDLGGTMRLGAQSCHIRPGSLAHHLYGSLEITERHRHRYEFNNDYRARFEAAGMLISGESSDATPLAEMVELKDHPFFIACQFHPEFKSKPNAPHPLFTGFIAAVYSRVQGK